MGRLRGLYNAKLASCENMPDYESSHLVSCQELAIYVGVGMLMISKVHNDIIVKSVMPKT